MSAMKVRACSTLNAMNPEQDTIDSLIRQAIGKEPFLSFSRAGDSPVQLIQLLHAFDQQGSEKISKSLKVGSCDDFKENSDSIIDRMNSFSSEPIKIMDHSPNGTARTSAQMSSRKIPEAVVAFAQAAAKATGETEKSNLAGWPLLSPSKAQLQKCDKCSREFCSSMNYRRHRRVHRRSLNVDKDSQKNRDFLGTFWDKLSADEAKELVSLRNVTVEEITGSSVTKALSTWFRKPGVLSSLPQAYIKAGLKLLDVVQASSSRSSISSQELFSVLDEASEKTFLCAGTALSLQKYVFDGEAVKKALEIKNIVACTSFLIEIELVKAWLVDKDAEALKCQKLLVDEEEAAQKRRAEILERKRRKKLRQKEQKMNETSNAEKIDIKTPSLDSSPDRMGFAETSSPRDSFEDCTSEASHNQEPQLSNFADSASADDDMNAEKSRTHRAETHNKNPSNCGNILDLASYADDPKQDAAYQTQRGAGPMLTKHSQNAHSRFLVNTRHNNSRDSKVIITRPSGRKVWAIKSRLDNEDDGKYGRDMAVRKLSNRSCESELNEVLIGSINVSLGDGDLQHSQRQGERCVKSDSGGSNGSKTMLKLWRPVSRHGNNGSSAQSDFGDEKPDDSATKDAERLLLPLGSCLASEGTVSDFEMSDEPMIFSSDVAKDFLAQRWKEAISGDQTVVIYSSETEAYKGFNPIECSIANSPPQTSGFHGRHILAHVENRLAGAGAVDAASNDLWHFKFKLKADKNSRLKYVPKQKD